MRAQAVIADVLRTATQQGRAIAIVPTADVPDVSLMDAGKAARIAQGLTPQPWLPDRARAAAAVTRAKFAARPQIIWLSDGIEDGHAGATADALAAAGSLKIYADGAGKGPLALLPPSSDPRGFDVTVMRAGTDGERSGEVSALGSHGEMLASARFHFDDGQEQSGGAYRPAAGSAQRDRAHCHRQHGLGRRGAASGRQRRASRGRHRVGGGNENEQPLLSDLYYLERALAPYADVRKGTVSDLLARNVSVLILADIGRVAGSDYDKIAKFVAGRRIADPLRRRAHDRRAPTIWCR